MKKEEKQLMVIIDLIKKGAFTWGDVVAEINERKLTPKNWMKIRGFIQYHINLGTIKRTPDLYTEKYERIVSIKNK